MRDCMVTTADSIDYGYSIVNSQFPDPAGFLPQLKTAEGPPRTGSCLPNRRPPRISPGPASPGGNSASLSAPPGQTRAVPERQRLHAGHAPAVLAFDLADPASLRCPLLLPRPRVLRP